VQPPRVAQMTYSRLEYAKKDFSSPGAAAYHAILVMHHLLRLTVLRFRGATESSSAPASALAVSVCLAGRRPLSGDRSRAHCKRGRMTVGDVQQGVCREPICGVLRESPGSPWGAQGARDDPSTGWTGSDPVLRLPELAASRRFLVPA
jgi:hypothetical protein